MKQPIGLLQSDRIITAATNTRNCREKSVYREQKCMQQNETKESEAYCNDVTCYCRRQRQQETVSMEANDANL